MRFVCLSVCVCVSVCVYECAVASIAFAKSGDVFREDFAGDSFLSSRLPNDRQLVGRRSLIKHHFNCLFVYSNGPVLSSSMCMHKHHHRIIFRFPRENAGWMIWLRWVFNTLKWSMRQTISSESPFCLGENRKSLSFSAFPSTNLHEDYQLFIK